MYKKSFLIIGIQLLGSLLGLLSLYWIAGDMSPEVYSLVGVYTVIASLTATFSDLGLETTMVREALYWKAHNDEKKLREYSSQALLSKACMFAVLLPILLAYVFFLNYTKYNGQQTTLLLCFLVGAAMASINNSMSLMVRAQGGYVFSQLVTTLNNTILKCIGIPLYYMFGAQVYLYFYGLSSLPVTVIYLVKLRKVLDFKLMSFRPMLKKVYTARYLWLRTYLDALKINADSILVSALFPASIMGSYSIFKNLENISKTFIEGFFDVLSQHTVRYKGDKTALLKQEKKFKLARNIVIAILVLGTAVYMVAPDYFVHLVNLEQYDGISTMILCVAVMSVLHLIGKYEINALAFFASSKLNFMQALGIFVITIVSFAWLIVIPSIYGVLSQRLTVYAAQSIVAIVLFYRRRNELYTEINQ